MIKNFIKYSAKCRNIKFNSLSSRLNNNANTNNNLSSIKLYSEVVNITINSSTYFKGNPDVNNEQIHKHETLDNINIEKNTQIFEYPFNRINYNLKDICYDFKTKLKNSNINSTTISIKTNSHLSMSSLKSSFIKTGCKNFSLYIPYKKLNFIKHVKHGNVYPVYVADTEHHRKSNPNKITPLLGFFTTLNFFVCLTGFQILPITKLYEFLFLSDTTVFFSVLFNIFLVKKYVDFLIKYRHRVKNLFLLPSGTQIIIESFDGTEKKVEIQDIFERRVYLRYEGTQKDSIFTNNDNSFRANIGWGFNKENFFDGKRKFMDYEILHQIIHRNNIDTTQVKFKAPEIPLNFLTSEEKRGIIRRFSGRKILEKFDFRNLKITYFYYKRRLFEDSVVFIRNFKKKNLENKRKKGVFSSSSKSSCHLNEEEKLNEKMKKEKSKIKILSFYD